VSDTCPTPLHPAGRTFAHQDSARNLRSKGRLLGYRDISDQSQPSQERSYGWRAKPSEDRTQPLQQRMF
jgi:hypothetical protein